MARSDPLPTILQGIPLDVRSIALSMNRPRFALNPTNCEARPVADTAFPLLPAGAFSPASSTGGSARAFEGAPGHVASSALALSFASASRLGSGFFLVGVHNRGIRCLAEMSASR